jgi:hypothetical protein
VLLLGQINDTAGAAVTVKLAVQVEVPQLLLAVKVTVFVPPHLSGAPVLLLDTVPFDELAVFNHDVNAEFAAAWSA